LGRDVEVPEIVMDDLEAPDTLAGSGAEGDERISIKVGTKSFSGLGLVEGTNTRSRSGSVLKIDQALAAPVWWAFGPFQVAYPLSAGSCGIGSQLQTRRPVWTS